MDLNKTTSRKARIGTPIDLGLRRLRCEYACLSCQEGVGLRKTPPKHTQI